MHNHGEDLKMIIGSYLDLEDRSDLETLEILDIKEYNGSLNDDDLEELDEDKFAFLQKAEKIDINFLLQMILVPGIFIFSAYSMHLLLQKFNNLNSNAQLMISKKINENNEFTKLKNLLNAELFCDGNCVKHKSLTPLEEEIPLNLKGFKEVNPYDLRGSEYYNLALKELYPLYPDGVCIDPRGAVTCLTYPILDFDTGKTNKKRIVKLYFPFFALGNQKESLGVKLDVNTILEEKCFLGFPVILANPDSNDPIVRLDKLEVVQEKKRVPIASTSVSGFISRYWFRDVCYDNKSLGYPFYNLCRKKSDKHTLWEMYKVMELMKAITFSFLKEGSGKVVNIKFLKKCIRLSIVKLKEMGIINNYNSIAILTSSQFHKLKSEACKSLSIYPNSQNSAFFSPEHIDPASK